MIVSFIVLVSICLLIAVLFITILRIFRVPYSKNVKENS